MTRIEPNYGTLLMVDHKPLIPLPRLSNSKYLPIKIAGLDITVNGKQILNYWLKDLQILVILILFYNTILFLGISWLQTIVNRKDINFIPLATEKNYVTCIVSMQQNKVKDNHFMLFISLIYGFIIIIIIYYIYLL